ncbi:unnamed protein product [Adineta steineri]|uniref:Uncharacterized protein n=1 Tax=Adineta steineri TaxID=433720 RepID=A0A814M980_9BILA|nr:unnamed protein product [Adineta steineri]CAF4271687.1 unnamed protein product [Adineta steineri]
MAASYLHQSTDEIEYVKMRMTRKNMDSILSYPLPSGYSFQLYKPNSNDDYKWAEIMLATGEFHTIEQAHELFVKEFLNHKDNHLLSQRLYFVVNSAIIPEYQGKKLAKPLVSAVLKKVSEYVY